MKDIPAITDWCRHCGNHKESKPRPARGTESSKQTPLLPMAAIMK